MIKLYQSNTLESLLSALLTHTRTPLSNPFEPETIVVQSHGMARWLSYAIAETHGIATNLDYVFPAAFIWRIYQHTLAGVPEATTYEAPALMWHVLRVLPQYLEHPAFTSVAHYLANDGTQHKRFQLACQVAEVFEQYLLYRPYWMLDWADTAQTHWQAILWKAITDSTPENHPAALQRAFLDAAHTGDLQTDDLPTRVSVFGIATLPPMLLAAFAQLAELTDVHLYQLTPSVSQTSAGLAALGKLGQDYVTLLHQYPHETQTLFSDPVAKGLLGVLQADMLAPTDRDKIPIPTSDVSVQIHLCHSRMREVEVLHDQLLNLLHRHPTLEPKDIMVMAPDIEAYAPFIEAVFHAAPHARALPWSIADRPTPVDPPIIQAFFQLLGLPQSRFEAKDILSLLAVPSIQQRFDLNTTGLQHIRQWITQSGIRWGLDQAMMANFGLPEKHQNTWAFGLERLLLGYAMPTGSPLFQGIAPCATIEGEAASDLGKLLAFLDQLSHYQACLSQPRNASEWVRISHALLMDFFADTDEHSLTLTLIRTALSELKQATDLAVYTQALSPEVARDYLQQHLAEPISEQGFLTGKITFCTLLPMRSIPCQVICLLGLNDHAFPRLQPPSSFDRMAKQADIGDRSQGDDDRYLLLEALSSARCCFYLSYVGRHIRDNSPLLPSVVLQTLLDNIEAGFEGEQGQAILPQITTLHPLQPFSPRYFSGNALFSYVDEWVAGAQTLSQPQPHTATFGEHSLGHPQDTDKTIELAQLIQFFKNPLRFFANARLNIWLDPHSPKQTSTESFQLSRLEHDQLQQNMLRAAVHAKSLRAHYPQAQAQGLLPVGHFSDLIYTQSSQPIEHFSRPIRQHLDNALDPVEIQLRYGEIQLQGWLHPITPEGLIRYRFAPLSAEDQITLWLQHLVLNTLADVGTPKASTHYAQDKKMTFPAITDAEVILKNLLILYWQGMKAPLPFFPETSHTLVQCEAEKKSAFWTERNLQQAWHGNLSVPGEKSSRYYQTFYRANEPHFNALFKKIARHVYVPLHHYRMITPTDDQTKQR